ncbi:hypothetical protein HNY73_007343 [Argiope bruennichi]|uniref:DDE Tnp4 domain-containing protein n=1 Tax=Argiope bruennichi TaxID=94029 RepID=A0A8T0FKN9_ARGBR|nr:hypothetical protein HNY73_007343 [Argiope bruennichi]
MCVYLEKHEEENNQLVAFLEQVKMVWKVHGMAVTNTMYNFVSHTTSAIILRPLIVKEAAQFKKAYQDAEAKLGTFFQYGKVMANREVEVLNHKNFPNLYNVTVRYGTKMNVFTKNLITTKAIPTGIPMEIIDKELATELPQAQEELQVTKDLKVIIKSWLTSAEQWHHVPSSQNPADLISRGLDPSSLHHSSLWWTGPPFLSTEDMSSSEPPPVRSIEEFQSEFKTNKRVFQHELESFKFSDSNNFVYLNAKLNNFVHDIIGLSNNYCRLIRILSYIYRLLNNCRANFPKNFGILKAIELKESEMRLLKIVQEEDFHKEIKSLKVSGFVNTDSQVAELAKNDLGATVRARLRKPLENDEDLGSFLSGTSVVEVFDISNIWASARKASKRLRVTWEFNDSVPRLFYKDLTIKPIGRRKVIFSIRDRLRMARSGRLLSKPDQGKTMECVAQSAASSHFITDGAYTRKLRVSGAIKWSRDIYVEHITGHRQFEENSGPLEALVPGEPEIDVDNFQRYFNFLTRALYEKLKLLPIFPPKSLVTETMPKQFRSKNKDCPVIIDCTEFLIQKPNSPAEQQMTFSFYKNANTLKGLIGIMPTGAISFISPLYCGSISDKELFIKSHLMDMLEPNDAVMADKGFQIEQELLKIRCKLKCPKFLRDCIQFDVTERIDNCKISNLSQGEPPGSTPWDKVQVY